MTRPPGPGACRLAGGWAAALLLALVPAAGAGATSAEQAHWQAHARAVTITRDDWGIAHVHGKTDADAVFGMIYAQAEDDFNRVESNYLTALGRTAEAEGPSALWADLRQKLFIDADALQALYRKSPRWLRNLMDAWADGLNDYLATHPDVHPKVLDRFEPWMALSFTEGSIGGDIERASLPDLAAFYGANPDVAMAVERPAPPSWREPTGSNGIAIAPKLTADGHALLLINPHTTFFFRSELQMTSDEGLDAYGAVTWGQFFVYQGFNRHAGWMHTSTGADVVDEFAETIVRDHDKLFYRYGDELRPVTTRDIVVRYRSDDGSLVSRTFTGYFTHHGPVVRAADGKWITMALMNKPVPALKQSWLRTRSPRLRELPEGCGAEGQFVQQHDLRRRPGRDRLSAPAVHPAARRPLRLHPAGRRQQPGDRLAGSHAAGRGTARGGSAQRLGVQHQRLAVLGGRARQPETQGLPALHGHVRRESARHSCHALLTGAREFHHPQAASATPTTPTCRRSPG